MLKLPRLTHKEQQIGCAGEGRQQLEIAYAEDQQQRHHQQAHVNAHIPHNKILIDKLLDALRNEDNVDAADAKVIEGKETIHKRTVQREREREGGRKRESVKKERDIKREKKREREREKKGER